jgi:hypothetical protein
MQTIYCFAKLDFKGREIKGEASKYLREISIVLNRIPREMLLLLKTNDLLRGLETNLGTRGASSSFIYMSKCCVQLINSYEREIFKNELVKNGQLSNGDVFSFVKLFRFNLFSGAREILDLLKIYIFQFYLLIMHI